MRCRCSPPCASIPGIEVGDNQPYSGQLNGDTLYRHGTARGLAHALIEVRQDLILSAEGQVEWAECLADVLRKVMREERALHAIELHGSYTDGARIEAIGSMPCKGVLAMDEKTRTELEAEAFRRLLAHLRERSDVREYRPHGDCRLLPELPVGLVSGGGRGEGDRAQQGGGEGDRLWHGL